MTKSRRQILLERPLAAGASRDLSASGAGSLENLIEQTPEEIHIAVNGLPLASQPVAGGRCDLSIGVPLQERIEFRRDILGA